MEEQIVLSRYQVTLEARDELILPDYWGSTLRGGFGHVFRRIACPARRDEPCPIPHQCPYHLIFETSPPPDSPALRTLDEIPRPFVIAPPPPGAASGAFNGRHPPGAELSFDLTLVGRAIHFFPYFVVTFRELGVDGLGRGRGRFQLERIDAIDPLNGHGQPAFLADDQLVRSVHTQVSLASCRERAPELSGRLTLRFLTPTRIKHAGQYVERPEFHAVFRALLRRLSSLALFHCDVRLDIDYRGLIAQAESIRLVEDRTRNISFERYSARQRQRMDLGGLVGEAVYEGDLTTFMPYLLFGQWTHVGKNATFGLGRYHLSTVGPNLACCNSHTNAGQF
jgi:hypothetical protein